jgi:hypothetical protein
VSWFRKHRPEPEKHEGREALAREEKVAREARDMGVEVNRLARSIRNLREENHFAEAITNLLKGNNK